MDSLKKKKNWLFHTQSFSSHVSVLTSIYQVFTLTNLSGFRGNKSSFLTHTGTGYKIELKHSFSHSTWALTSGLPIDQIFAINYCIDQWFVIDLTSALKGLKDNSRRKNKNFTAQLIAFSQICVMPQFCTIFNQREYKVSSCPFPYFFCKLLCGN